jgi:hypothetical protein
MVSNLLPVGGFEARRFVVQGGDCGLQLIGARLMLLQRLSNQLDPFRDVRSVPQPAILLGHQNQLAVWTRPRGAPRICQQHQREQACDFRIVRQQLMYAAA